MDGRIMSLPATGGRVRSLPTRCRSLRPDAELTLDDVVIKNQVGCRPENGRAMFWPDTGGHTPWREEIGVQENAAGQMRDPQDVG